MDKWSQLIEALLENQEKLLGQTRKLSDFDIEPFSWMDPQMKAILEAKLTPEEMNALDQSARMNMMGRKVMMDATRQALERVLGKRSESSSP